MSGKMQVTMKLDQRLMMSQQLRQAITLLQYNTLDLKQLVQQCIETNPLIDVEEIEQVDNQEEDQPLAGKFSADLSKRGQYFEDEGALENYAIPETLRDHLLEQCLLCRFDRVQQIVAQAIIDSMDDNGFLTMSLEDIRQTILADDRPDENFMLDVLKTVQTFDPMGVGSRDMRECLLIQLEYTLKQDAVWKIAHKLLSNHFEEVSTHDTKKLIKQLGLTQDQFSKAMTLIRTLNPHPGILYSNDMNSNIEPELYVKKIKNEWRVFLADSILTNIKINSQYRDAIKQNKKHESYQALKQELEEAKSLISGLKRRNETLLAVASHIVKLQKDFLEYGQANMKSLNIVDVSQALELHESTVSRVTTGKYIATPRGVYELKYFFPSHVSTQTGEMCSAIAVKSFIKEIINTENGEHVYSDEEIASLLKQKGIIIARRTIAKYREAMKILPSYQRMRVLSTEVE